MSFPCTQCGACCMMAGHLGIMPARDDGACIYLGDDNLCTVYEDRPDVCRIDRTREIMAPDVSPIQWTVWNAMACNILIDNYELGDEHKINVDELRGSGEALRSETGPGGSPRQARDGVRPPRQSAVQGLLPVHFLRQSQKQPGALPERPASPANRRYLPAPEGGAPEDEDGSSEAEE